MRSLLIIRHAKSDWNNLRLDDFDRHLNERGHRNAADMAGRMVGRGILPDLILTSPALRAKTTAGYFASAMGIVAERCTEDPRIYEASLRTLKNLVNSFQDQYKLVALFGHNPGLTQLAEDLSGSFLGNLPTCAAVLIEFPADAWKSVSGGTGQVRLFDYPKNELTGQLD